MHHGSSKMKWKETFFSPEEASIPCGWPLNGIWSLINMDVEWIMRGIHILFGNLYWDGILRITSYLLEGPPLTTDRKNWRLQVWRGTGFMALSLTTKNNKKGQQQTQPQHATTAKMATAAIRTATTEWAAHDQPPQQQIKPRQHFSRSLLLGQLLSPLPRALVNYIHSL